jgi:hypothetical protein
VAVLDSIVRAAFAESDVVLARWQVAKRLQSLPGGTPATEPAPAATNVTAKQPSAA